LTDDRADAGERRGAVRAHVVAEHAHAAGGRLGEAEQQADERGFAGAVGAEESERDATGDLEADVDQGVPRAEALAETVCLDCV
jgi:hypothetical protein